ncbi:MAG: DUF4058 family protein [Chloroflexota bacterium]
MAYRFPGMDPYLEAPNIWRGFHHRIADEIADTLNPKIGPKYYADIEVTTTFEEVSIGKSKTVVPDVAVLAPTSDPTPALPATAVAVAEPAKIDEPIRRAVNTVPTKLRAVRVYVTETDELITSIEILSPYNKREPGLAEYRRKRSSILASNVHLVEIDLLRGGQRVGSETQGPPLDDVDYILLVNRGNDVNPGVFSDIWPGVINKPLPILPIPLEAPDPDVPLDLNMILRAVYTRAAYSRRIDYTQPVPAPKLRPEMGKWVEEHLAMSLNREEQ